MKQLAQGVQNRTGYGAGWLAGRAAVFFAMGVAIGLLGTKAAVLRPLLEANASIAQMRRFQLATHESMLGMRESIMKNERGAAEKEWANGAQDTIYVTVDLDASYPPEILARAMIVSSGKGIEEMIGFGWGESIKKSPQALGMIKDALDEGAVKDTDACAQLAWLLVEAEVENIGRKEASPAPK